VQSWWKKRFMTADRGSLFEIHPKEKRRT